MNENFQIRAARPEDAAAIVSLIGEFAEFEKLSDVCGVTEDDLRRAIFGENSFVKSLVARSENVFVGYAIFFPVFKSFRGERSIFLEDLYVSPEFRRRGLGLLMLSEVAKYAKTQGFTRMDWQALKWNTPAVEFYKKLGAETDDENLDFRLRGANCERLAS